MKSKLKHPELDLSPDVLRKEILHGAAFLERLKQLREWKIRLPYIARGPENAQWVVAYRVPKRPVWAIEPQGVDSAFDEQYGF